MRIAFCGKGGSGKTTLSSNFAGWLASKGDPVLAIDADLNQHMGRALGLSQKDIDSLPEMGTAQDFLKDYVRGNNPLIPSNQELVKTSPPYKGAGMIRLERDNPVLKHYAYQKDNFRFIRVGGFTDDDIGTSCYHAKTGAVELFLNYTLDRPEDTIVVDMTAGADSFASGLFTRFDLTVLAVEPTLRALSVVEQYKEYAEKYDVELKVVGNKIEDEDDAAFLQDRLGDDLLGVFPMSRTIRKKDKGIDYDFGALEPENIKCLNEILDYARGLDRDWDRYWAQAVSIHIKNAESWANTITGVDLSQQVRRDYLQKLRA